MKFLLTILFGLLVIPAKLLLLVTGRDPLMMRDDGRASYWVELPEPPDGDDYFKQGSPDGRPGPKTPRGVASIIVPFYRWIAGLYAPERPTGGERPVAVRDERIPDENYTLW